MFNNRLYGTYLSMIIYSWKNVEKALILGREAVFSRFLIFHREFFFMVSGFSGVYIYRSVIQKENGIHMRPRPPIRARSRSRWSRKNCELKPAGRERILREFLFHNCLRLRSAALKKTPGCIKSWILLLFYRTYIWPFREGFHHTFNAWRNSFQACFRFSSLHYPLVDCPCRYGVR